MSDRECHYCHARPATDTYDGEPACDRCWCRMTDEALTRFVSHYYGGDTPFTVAEQSHRKDGSE